MSRNDGGAAFPLGANEYAGHGPVSGMSLRDYFIAHAPTDPQSWFEPELPPKPVIPHWRSETGELLEDLKSYWDTGTRPSTPEGVAWLERFEEMQKAHEQWDRNWVKQRAIQWPAAWADAQIELRAKQMGSDV